MKTYHIHNNGDRPFCVYVYSDYNFLVIYRQTYNDEMETYVIDHKVYETHYTKLFFGSKSDSGYWEKGNSILVHVDGNEYINIGSEVYSFRTVNDEKIHKYVSEIGNSDVIYNYAVGENNTYLLAESVHIKNKDLASETEVYEQYHGHDTDKKRQKIKGTNIKKKVIHKHAS